MSLFATAMAECAVKPAEVTRRVRSVSEPSALLATPLRTADPVLFLLTGRWSSSRQRTICPSKFLGVRMMSTRNTSELGSGLEILRLLCTSLFTLSKNCSKSLDMILGQIVEDPAAVFDHSEVCKELLSYLPVELE